MAPPSLRSAPVPGFADTGLSSAEDPIMSYPFGDKHFIDVEPETDAPIVLPSASRAERNVPCASTAHCTVNSVLGQGAGTRFQSESLLEYRHKLVLSSRPEIADIREQVRFRYGRLDQHEVVFDLVVTKTDGRRIACSIKPEKRLRSGRHIAEMQAVSWWVLERDFADEVCILTEADLDPVELYNAQIYAAVRNADPEADGAARAVAAGLIGGRKLRDLTDELGLGPRGYRALLRLLRDRVLRCLQHARITPETFVTPVDPRRA